MPDVEVGFWGRIGGRIKEWRIAQLRFIDDWRQVLKRAWTMRISIVVTFLGVVFALMALVSDWMQKIVGPWMFSVSFLVIGMSVGLARLFKQPGTEDEN